MIFSVSGYVYCCFLARTFFWVLISAFYSRSMFSVSRSTPLQTILYSWCVLARNLSCFSTSCTHIFVQEACSLQSFSDLEHALEDPLVSVGFFGKDVRLVQRILYNICSRINIVLQSFSAHLECPCSSFISVEHLSSITYCYPFCPLARFVFS